MNVSVHCVYFVKLLNCVYFNLGCLDSNRKLCSLNLCDLFTISHLPYFICDIILQIHIQQYIILFTIVYI